jgi:hypothetical protein
LKLVKNVAQRNDVEGFQLAGTKNTMVKNRAFDNVSRGINQNGTNSKHVRNTALGNGTGLVDQNSNCDSNTWKKNIFATSTVFGSGACIE